MEVAGSNPARPTKESNMIVGIRKETKNHEYRVALLPYQVVTCKEAGAKEVWVEEGAGEGSKIEDSTYKLHGAKIKTREEILKNANIIIGVKELNNDELDSLSEDQIDVCFQHYAAHNRKAKCKQYAYEDYVVDGHRPILKPMSTIAGRLAVLEGMRYLLGHNGGKGVLITGIKNIVSPARVLVLGAGTVGFNAAITAARLGAHVTVFDIDKRKLDFIDELSMSNLMTTTMNPPNTLSSDMIIGAVYVPEKSAPKLLSRMIFEEGTPPGTVFVDVSIDQGGCAETSRPTTHDDPVYTEAGILHYCVPNIPGIVGHAATEALCSESIAFITKIIKENE